MGTLSDHKLKKGTFVFQQDNDPKHTLGVATAWFKKHHIPILPWPSHSPDMNIIEHVWGYLESIVHKHRPPPHNKNELWAILQRAWAELDLEYIQQLYQSMPRRVNALRLAKGLYTKY